MSWKQGDLLWMHITAGLPNQRERQGVVILVECDLLGGPYYKVLDGSIPDHIKLMIVHRCHLDLLIKREVKL